jgi:hypothetical protein
MKLVLKKDNKEIIQEGNHFFVRVTEGNGGVTESQDYNTIDRAKASIGIIHTIEENNRLLAEFMQPSFNGFGTYDFNGQLLTKEYLKFHNDWNWLMEVVEKILNICLELDNMEMYYNITDSIPKIDKAYNDCVEFIKWYNENK